jgi:hypothetical protein
LRARFEAITLVTMSTLLEIQEAITHLNVEEKSALSLWLNSQMPLNLTSTEEEALLRSLDAAARDLSAGKGVPLDEVRNQMRSWVIK